MFKLALKNLAQNKIRLGLTAFAIVLGVGFVVSSFVLRDGLKDVFGNLAEEIVAGVDLGISSANPELDPITQADLDAISSIDGIREAELEITGEGAENLIQPIKPDGSTITLQGPPQLVFGWTDGESSITSIIDGRAPAAFGEWVIDPPSLEEHGFVVGETYDFITPSGRQSGQLVGTFTYNGFVEGPTFMAMTSDTARNYLLYGDRFDSISIVADGSVPVPELQQQVNLALNPDPTMPRRDVRDKAALIDDTQAEFNQALDIIGGILLGFALVALFVSIFIIANTFAITTSQRTRELGLLRAIGATPLQVMRSVVAESFVIGLLSSLVGIGAGVVIAYALRAILNTIGLAIPEFGVVLRPQTILYAFLVGTGVTVLSAIFPAIGASRTSPIAAITGHSDTREKSITRFVIGALITSVGILLMLLGLFGGADSVLGVLGPLGAGAAILFIGITLLSPLVAGPLSQIIGTPISRIYRTPGRLSKDNAARNPRRTATTAAALMIGLSLVSMASVLGDSFKAEFDRILNTSVQGDYLVTSDQADIPDEVVQRIIDDEAFGNTTAVKYGVGTLANPPVDANAGFPADAIDENGNRVGFETDFAAFDYNQLDGLFNLSVIDGDLTSMTNDTTAVRDSLAEDLGLGIGDTISLNLNDGTVADLEIVAIFEEAQVSSRVLLTFDRFSDVSTQRTSDWVAASIAPDVTVEAADAAFIAIGNEYPNLAFQSSAEFRKSFSDQIDFMLNLLTVLLGLTIIIAMLGIANTLALSVFERTREIGLLRAVGMTRKQTRRMIRWEAVIISAVGAVLGTLLGVALGVLMVNAIPGGFISEFAIPWIRIISMVLIASFLGLLAALFPAWRASRMNVLEAISHS